MYTHVSVEFQHVNVSNDFGSEGSCFAFSLLKSEAKTRKWASRTASLAWDTSFNRMLAFLRTSDNSLPAFSQSSWFCCTKLKSAWFWRGIWQQRLWWGSCSKLAGLPSRPRIRWLFLLQAQALWIPALRCGATAGCGQQRGPRTWARAVAIPVRVLALALKRLSQKASTF